MSETPEMLDYLRKRKLYIEKKIPALETRIKEDMEKVVKLRKELRQIDGRLA